MTGSVIRRIRSDDSIGDLTALLHRAYARWAAKGFRYLASRQDAEMTRRRISKGECYVAVLGGRLVGTVTLKDRAHMGGCPWYERPGVVLFGQFAVDPEHQGKGIGSALLRTIERRAAEKGMAELALDTAEGVGDLIRMYEARGYRFVGYIQWEVTNYRSVVLSKKLTGGDGHSDTIEAMQTRIRWGLRELPTVCEHLATGRQVFVLQREALAREFVLFGEADIRLHAEVVDEIPVADLDRLRALEGMHAYPWAEVERRFREGARALVLRVRSLRAALPTPDRPGPWVEFEEGLTVDLDWPVFNRTDFRKRLEKIQEILGD